MNQERHEMILEKTHPSGEDEWYCPTCGRRFLMQWPPNYKRTILEAGDEQVSHSGGKGNISVGQTSMASEAISSTDGNDPGVHTEDSGLAPWISWMDEVGFEDLWNNKD